MHKKLLFAALLAGSVWLAADLWDGYERSELLGVPWKLLRLIANALAAVQAGVPQLDASIGGIGGCPFAPNATGNIGTEFVAKSASDGYTVLVVATSFGTTPALKRTLPFDPVKSFAPVALLAASEEDRAFARACARDLWAHRGFAAVQDIPHDRRPQPRGRVHPQLVRASGQGLQRDARALCIALALQHGRVCEVGHARHEVGARRVLLEPADQVGDGHVGPRRVACLLDRRDQRIQRFLVARETRPPAAFVRHAGERPALRHQLAGYQPELYATTEALDWRLLARSAQTIR